MDSKFIYLQNKIKELDNRVLKLKLKSALNNISLITNNLFDPIIKGKISGYENTTKQLKVPSLIWYFGNLCYIIEKNCYLILNENDSHYFSFHINKFDYRKISIEDTYCEKYFDISVMYTHYNDMIFFINQWIDSNFLFSLSKTLIERVLYYNSFINERIIESYKFINIKPESLLNRSIFNLTDYLDPKIDKLKFVTIVGGIFTQGYLNSNSSSYQSDNQKPSFSTHIKSFQISETLVTETLFLDFIESGCYEDETLWTLDGWKWKTKNNITHPQYWLKKDNKWYKKEYDTDVLIQDKKNRPMTHISWYEAIAYCIWCGGRLPFEDEWEYIATNRGTTTLPWGLEKIGIANSNVDFNYSEPSNVLGIKGTKSLFGISDLIGNVHEWCLDSYLPYDNFQIDHINSSILYNNFDARKKVLKGGSFLSSSYFLTPQNRFGAYPENRIIINGFRVVKDIKKNVKQEKTNNSSSEKDYDMIIDTIKKELLLKECMESITFTNSEDESIDLDDDESIDSYDLAQQKESIDLDDDNINKVINKLEDVFKGIVELDKNFEDYAKKLENEFDDLDNLDKLDDLDDDYSDDDFEDYNINQNIIKKKEDIQIVNNLCDSDLDSDSDSDSNL